MVGQGWKEPGVRGPRIRAQCLWRIETVSVSISASRLRAATERDEALEVIRRLRLRRFGPKTVGADKAYDVVTSRTL